MSGVEALEYAGAFLVATVAFVVLLVALGAIEIKYTKSNK